MVNQWNELPGHHEHVGKQKVGTYFICNSPQSTNSASELRHCIEGEQEDLINQIDNEHALVGIRSNIRNGTIKREVWDSMFSMLRH